MAESWQARARRYARGDFTRAELLGAVGFLLIDKVIDVATFGKINQLTGKALAKVVVPLVTKTTTRVALPAVTSVARTGFGVGRLLFKNPYVLGATAIYVGIKERERIKQLLDQGYEIVEEEIAPPVSQFLQEEIFTPETVQRAREMGTISIPSFARPTRRPSKFNKAVSQGMKAIKKSTSYGRKGTIKPAKKAFALVTKLASAKKKKKKAPKSGIRRRIWNAMKGLL
jgi:hypothetical protein